MVGLGCQDTLNFVLIGKDEVGAKMNLPTASHLIEVANPYAEQYNVVRPSVLPSLLIVLSNNLHREYPQNIFEIGKTAHLDTGRTPARRKKITSPARSAMRRPVTTRFKSKLQSLCLNFGKLDKLRTVAADHPSYIPGRCAEIYLGDKKVALSASSIPWS